MEICWKYKQYFILPSLALVNIYNYHDLLLYNIQLTYIRNYFNVDDVFIFNHFF